MDELGDIVPERAAAVLRPHLEGPKAAPASESTLGLGLLGLALGSVTHARLDGSLADRAAELAPWLAGAASGDWPAPPPVPRVGRELHFSGASMDERRAALLNATVKVVARSGLKNANLRRISRACGLSHSVIYASHGSLEALLTDLVNLAHTTYPALQALLPRYTDPAAAAANLAGWVDPRMGPSRRLALEFHLGALGRPPLAELTTQADDRLYRALADQVAPAGRPEHGRFQLVARTLRNLTIGLMVLEESAGGLAGRDWRVAVAPWVSAARGSG